MCLCLLSLWQALCQAHFCVKMAGKIWFYTTKDRRVATLFPVKSFINIVFKGYGLKRAEVFTSALFYVPSIKVCNKKTGAENRPLLKLTLNHKKRNYISLDKIPFPISGDKQHYH